MDVTVVEQRKDILLDELEQAVVVNEKLRDEDY